MLSKYYIFSSNPTSHHNNNSNYIKTIIKNSNINNKCIDYKKNKSLLKELKEKMYM